MKRALQAVLAISLAGVAFSGTLTYREFVSHAGACTPLAAPGTLFGYPPCVYGLAMYALLAVIAAWGLRTR
jgi:uncharacterized membrane protein